MNIGNKLKAVVAGGAAVVSAVSAAMVDNVLDFGEAATVVSILAGAVATAYVVWRTPNKP